jgi:hypothetical protein
LRGTGYVGRAAGPRKLASLGTIRMSRPLMATGGWATGFGSVLGRFLASFGLVVCRFWAGFGSNWEDGPPSLVRFITSPRLKQKGPENSQRLGRTSSIWDQTGPETGRSQAMPGAVPTNRHKRCRLISDENRPSPPVRFITPHAQFKTTLDRSIEALA